MKATARPKPYAPPTKITDRQHQISETNYPRPKLPKVHCDQCNEHPGGFRGFHELQRHVDAEHKGWVRKRVCQDPWQLGIPTDIVAITPLDK